MKISTLKMFSVFLVLATVTSVFSGFNLSSSFWLDETLTSWMIAGSFSEVYNRVHEYQLTSPLYFWIAWTIKALFGQSELALRIPSLLAAAATLFLTYRLVLRWFSQVPALISVVLLASSGDFVSIALSARPYSLALLCSLLCVQYALAWSEDDRRCNLAATLLFVTFAFYLHYLAGITTFPLLLLAFLRHRFNGHRLTGGKLSLVAGWGIVLLPGVSHLFEIGRRSGQYSYVPPVTLVQAWNSIIPADIVSFLLASILVGLLIVPPTRATFKVAMFGRLPWFIAWALLPALTLVAISLMLENSLLISRYHLIGFVGAAVLGGALTSLLDDRKFQLISLTLVATLVMFFPRSWRLEDWRGAVATIHDGRDSQGAVTLLYSGLIEAESPEWMLDQKKHEYLLAPVMAYGSKTGVLPIAKKLDNRYFNQSIEPALQKADSVELIVLRPPSSLASEAQTEVFFAYQQLLIQSGFVESSFQNYGLVSTAVFTRKGKPTNGQENL